MVAWFENWLPSEYLAIEGVQAMIACVVLFVGAMLALYIFDACIGAFRNLWKRR